MSSPIKRTPSSSADSPANEPVVRTDRRVLLNTSALAGSSLWRIGLSFVLQLFIANRLGAVGLGQYTTALAYLNVCQILSELGLPQLLVRDLAHEPQKRRHYFRVALGLQLGASSLIAVILAVVLTVFQPFQPVTQAALLVIVISLPFFAISSVCATVFQAGERMELVMLVEMVVNIIIAVGSIAVLWREGTVVHLAAVMIVSQAFSALMYWALLMRTGMLVRQLGDEKWHDTVQLLWRKALPFYGLSLSNVLLQRVDILLLSVIAGEIITGVYSAAYLVVRVFLVLSQTYWQAIYPTLSRLRHQMSEQSWRLATLAIRYGLMGLLPISAIFSGAAEPLLGMVFRGEDYAASVPVFAVLIWTPPLFLIASFAVNLLLVERYPHLSLTIALTHLLTTLLLLPSFSAVWGALGAAYAVLIAVCCSAIVGFVWIRYVRITVSLSSRWPLLALATLSILLVQYLFSLFVPASLWPLTALVALSIYLAFLWYSALFSIQDLMLFKRALRK
ncbi:oligosaccharide flippase family protein [bacterium]|nr:oligosaccharide flippase family protein [bacterium]